MLKNFERMHGGEIYVPKIPSVRITDLATAMAPNLEQRIIGIRPGEKVHEVMCPKDDSHLTLEFRDHFVIKPTILFADKENDFSTNKLGEISNLVEQGFEYNSGNNEHFLNIEEIASMNERVKKI